MGRISPYTAEQKAEALAVYAEHGPTEVERRLGIGKGTVSKWARETGTTTVRNEKVAAATESARVTMEHRRTLLASGLMDDALRMREQFFAPCVEKVVKTLGRDEYARVEIVDVEREQPTFGDQQRIATAIAILVDKLQLLTGQATSRTETVTLDAIDAEIAKLRAEMGESDTSPVEGPSVVRSEGL